MSESESHRLSISVTNQDHVVGVCSCGWVGGVHIPSSVEQGNSERFYRDVDRAQRNARDEHKAHARAALTADAGR